MELIPTTVDQGRKTLGIRVDHGKNTREKIDEDYETKRVLNFESVLSEHELIENKKRVLNSYYFIN
jgi:hypothetical protein